MTREAVAQRQQQTQTREKASSGLFQRKCSCGQHTGGGECAECRTKRQLQRRVQPKLRIGAPNDVFEREADRVASAVTQIRVEREKAEEIPISASVGSPQGSLSSAGRPLPPHTRSFFEKRMGHDFGSIRVHTGSRADRLARSVQARAFTYGRDLVFAKGEYENGTRPGRHLLAHELAHTIQQGAAQPLEAAATPKENRPTRRAGVAQLQRLCADLATPPPMTCDIGRSSPGSSATFVLFPVDSPILTPAAQSTVQSIARAWHLGGGSGILRLDGFASVEGTEEHNCPLSCDRANAVAAELFAPSNSDPGVPVDNLEIFAQGETSQYGSSRPPNRRVVITTTGGAPAPGPPCSLTVAGPDEVNHICAPYVPSDAVACGDDTPTVTLTAAGAAAGTTPSWSIIRGTTRASIVGSTTGASISIKGDAMSGAQGDVTVQITDGTCTTTHGMTVRQPSIVSVTPSPTVTPTFVRNFLTYTVGDQFGNPMASDICVDETVTICSTSQPISTTFGDAPTDRLGQVNDDLAVGPVPGGIPAGFCVFLNQTITAGGCGPLARNTIVMKASGITLNQNSSCAAGDPCP